MVVDEAYIEYVERRSTFPDASRWLDEFPNLVVTRTFSKAYGLAGLRVGYALSHPSVAGLLNRVRQPFNVNSIALAAARAALEDEIICSVRVATNRDGMAQLERGLDALRCATPAVASAISYSSTAVGRRRPIYEAMLRQGVIVRPVGNYQLPNHLRVTIGTQAQNQRMLDAFEAML